MVKYGYHCRMDPHSRHAEADFFLWLESTLTPAPSELIMGAEM